MHPNVRVSVGSRFTGTGTAGTDGTSSTPSAPWSAGIPKDLRPYEARLDAEQLREQIVKAPIIGEADEGSSGPTR
jgi:hypothetical protein